MYSEVVPALIIRVRGRFRVRVRGRDRVRARDPYEYSEVVPALVRVSGREGLGLGPYTSIARWCPPWARRR